MYELDELVLILQVNIDFGLFSLTNVHSFIRKIKNVIANFVLNELHLQISFLHHFFSGRKIM